LCVLAVAGCGAAATAALPTAVPAIASAVTALPT
jgi:hypothetical protein